MKRILLSVAAGLIAVCSFAQNEVQNAAAAAAEAISETPETKVEPPKPKYWTNSLMTQLNLAQTSYTNWAKGGNNNVAFTSFINGIANYDKDKFIWKNELKIDYGFMYSSDKPIMQKSKDRMLLESTAGYKATKTLSYAAKFTFLNQFSRGYTYGTPAVENPSHRDWKDARVLKSGFFAPAIATLGLGIDWVPNNWLTVNFSPLTGGANIVAIEELRHAYGMKVKDKYKAIAENEREGFMYRPVRFELGAQLTADAKVKVNDNFEAGTHLILFSNYLKNPQNLRVNWDNTIMWKLAKYFTLTITTNLIYDDTVLIVDEDHPEGHKAVQLLEGLMFGFTYTFASKK